MKSPVSKVNKGFALATGTAVALLALSVSPGAQENAVAVASLNLQNECDRLAGSPSDNQRNKAFGAVETSEIAASAIGSCRLAFEATGNPRFAYQLGRALNKANEIDEAMLAYQTAAQADYPAARSTSASFSAVSATTARSSRCIARQPRVGACWRLTTSAYRIVTGSELRLM